MGRPRYKRTSETVDLVLDRYEAAPFKFALAVEADTGVCRDIVRLILLEKSMHAFSTKTQKCMLKSCDFFGTINEVSYRR